MQQQAAARGVTRVRLLMKDGDQNGPSADPWGEGGRGGRRVMARKGVLRATSFTADFQQLACCWTDRLAAQALTGGSGLRPASRSARRRRGGMQGRWILTLLVCVGVSRDGRMLSAGGKLIAPRLRGPVHRRLVSSNIGGAARWVGGEVGLHSCAAHCPRLRSGPAMRPGVGSFSVSVTLLALKRA